jgi:DNA-binding transcriptional LysR family regulator
MDWDLCRTFVAVAETRSFTGAARRLRSSHPTVGRKIAALEAQLGARLFARAADGLCLTSEGRRFHEHAEAMAAAALRAETAVSATGRKARGVVKLSIGATLAAHWLMPRMGGFLREHAHLQLEIITHPFPASVRRREADVVLRPVDSGEENLIGRKIGRLGTGFYSSRDYAARRRLPERRDEWKGHSVIGFADRASNAQLARWSDFVTRQGSVVMRCSSQGDMLAAARAGIGISALSCLVATTYPDLVRVAPQKLASVSDLWLLAHPDLVALPAVRAVVDFVADCARADRIRLRG